MNNLIIKLLNETESNYLDFKKEWHSNKVDLLYDILCFSNSLSNEEYRYIVIGVKEDSKTKVKEYYDVECNDNRKTEEDIITFLREYMYTIPEIKVNTHIVEEKNIDIISIKSLFRDLPYALKKEISYQGKKVIKNIISSRDGAVNTPITEGANISTIEELFYKRSGNHLTPIKRFQEYINDLENWVSSDEYNKSFYYVKNSNFTINVNETDNDNIRYLNKLDDYLELLRDTYLSEDIWLNKRRPMDCAMEEKFEWFNVDIFYKNTKLYSFGIMHIFLKRYPNIGDAKSLYLPLGLNNPFKFDLDKDNLKESIKSLIDYKLCSLLHKFNNSYEGHDEVLNYLNYEYLNNPSQYREEKKDFMYASRD